MKKFSRNFLAAFILLTFISCAYNQSYVNSTYRVLSVSKISYENSMNIVKDLQIKGILTSADVSRVSTYAKTYSEAHNGAVKMLAKYKESGDSADMSALDVQIQIASDALVSLLEIIRPYLVEAK